MPDRLNNDFQQPVSSSIDINEYLEKFRLRENGGRRLGFNRRRYEYTLYIPERRGGHERRAGRDRRKAPRHGSRLTSSSA